MKNSKFFRHTRKELKKYPFLFKWTRRLLHLFKIVPNKHPCMEDGDYFYRQFVSHQNIHSISFEKGLAVGSFMGTSYLLKIHPQNMIESCVYLDGIWEPHIIEMIAGYLQNSKDIVIDVGANIGATSIPLAKHFPEAQFYLYEPHPFVFKDLRNNVSYNKLTNVYVHNAAITNNANHTLPFYAQKNTHNFGLSSFKLNHDIEDYDVIAVNCLSLDSKFLCIEDKVKLIKIDTQGHELEVLLSAEKIITRDRPVILFEFESEYFESQSDEVKAKEALIKYFEGLNYEIFMNHSTSKFLPKLTLNAYFHGDIIAVPLADPN